MWYRDHIGMWVHGFDIFNG